jgi:uncharacterized protein
VTPFVQERDGTLQVDFLEDPDGRVVRFLDRLLRLARRLEGRSRRVVAEGLRRQERRVRDARRLDGLSRTLLSLCRFEPPGGAERAAEVREALFRARGLRWPPVPGDAAVPYEAAAQELGLTAQEVERLVYADEPDALVLRRAPRTSAAGLLRRYNLDLARAVLLEAEEVELRARGGWKEIFRAVKLARLMHRIRPGAGEGEYRLELTGPAAPFVTRPRRYGIRFARVVPALVRAPGWELTGRIPREGRTLEYRLSPDPIIAPRARRRARYDSSWEADLAQEFQEKIGKERGGWRLRREDTPVALGEEVFLPDFTFRHGDGRTALVEIVGFWTPEYLDEKVRKVRAAGLDHLVLVVFRGLAASRDEEELEGLPGEVVWFRDRVRIGPVMEAVERVARVGAEGGKDEAAPPGDRAG